MMIHRPAAIAAPLVALAVALHAAVTAAATPAPAHVGPPQPEHAATNRAFTGIPSLAVAPGGRLWATWYAGVTPGEDANNYVVLATSGDGGGSWTELLTVDPDGPGSVRAFDPELWVAPDGRLFFFWAQMEKGRRDPELGVSCVETKEADAARASWSQPRRIGDGVMMCKPLVLSSGEWALPISRWKEHDKSAQLVVSADAGTTWTVRGACDVPKEVRNFDEHMVVERKDGSLWMLVRTTYGIGESVSADRGVTWPELVPATIPHPAARFFVRRLASGNLLLVKHGPLDQQTGRSHLTAYVSSDDGRTWGGGLLLDERKGVSYPDGQETPDGLIRIIYDRNRITDREILLATFREADAAAGKNVSGTVKLQQRVSKASGGREKGPPDADAGAQQRPGPAAAQSPPEFAAIRDDSRLPRVLLMGDSVSIGYALDVRRLLAGVANVHRVPANCGSTKTALGSYGLVRWLPDEGECWDVIHFNHGLHDLSYRFADDRDRNDAGEYASPTNGGRPNVPLDVYAENLRRIVDRLERTGATLIFASTTPVPESDAAKYVEDAELPYNDAARRVMADEGVEWNDLWALVKPRQAELQGRRNVHFTPAGSAVMAEQVAARIRGALARRPASTATTVPR